jgi:preprotein translocase subunit SecE
VLTGQVGPTSREIRRDMADNKGSGYIQEVVKEMNKVHWPKQKELVSNTSLTLIASFILALFIFFADKGISQILQFIYG